MQRTPPPSTPASRDRPRVAIVGAGAIGLAIAWRLAQAGARVEVFERGAAGTGASWAAAGMLAAGLEAEPGEETLFTLCRASQRLWPAFAAELEAAASMPIGYRTEGTLGIAITQDDAAGLRFACEHQAALGVRLEWLTGAEVRRREPHLRPGLAGAVLSPDDHQVDNRLLVRALLAACRNAGVVLNEQAPVRAIDTVAGRARGVVVGDAVHAADIVVLAAGAWSGGLDGIPPEARPPVRPVKGQMLALAMDPAAPLLAHVLWTGHAYLVPRRDGRLLVGATVEEKGFDGALTAGGLLALLDAAWRAIPAIEELPVIETWVGFRPGSRDDAPVLGPSPAPGLVLATGHHRNGILLTPVTAAAIAESILEGRPPELIRPFAIDRFVRPPAAEAMP